MDQALVQDTQNDIDGDQCGADQPRLGAQRLLVGQQGSGKKTLQAGRRAETLLHLGYGVRSVAQR